MFDSGGTELLDADGDPTNGFSATVLTDGTYYADVRNAYWVRNGRAYELLGQQSWDSAQAAAVALGSSPGANALALSVVVEATERGAE